MDQGGGGSRGCDGDLGSRQAPPRVRVRSEAWFGAPPKCWGDLLGWKSLQGEGDGAERGSRALFWPRQAVLPLGLIRGERREGGGLAELRRGTQGGGTPGVSSRQAVFTDGQDAATHM